MLWKFASFMMFYSMNNLPTDQNYEKFQNNGEEKMPCVYEKHIIDSSTCFSLLGWQKFTILGTENRTLKYQVLFIFSLCS